MQSCEPAYSVYVKNERVENIEVLISGEELLNDMNFVRMENDNYVYSLDSLSERLLFTIVNQDLTQDKFPFDTIHVFTSMDTLRLNGKGEIFDIFEDIYVDSHAIVVQ